MGKKIIAVVIVLSVLLMGLATGDPTTKESEGIAMIAGGIGCIAILISFLVAKHMERKEAEEIRRRNILALRRERLFQKWMTYDLRNMEETAND